MAICLVPNLKTDAPGIKWAVHVLVQKLDLTAALNWPPSLV